MTEEFPSPQLIDEDLVEIKDPNRVYKDLFAGTMGGVAQVLVGQPFDTTKVRLQTSKVPTNAMDVVSKLWKNEGFPGFYKGTLTPLIGVGACVSVQFGVNEYMKRYFHSRNGSNPGDILSLSQYYLCGITGGISNAFLASPIEHIRIRLQTQTSNVKVFNGPLDCIKKLVKSGNLMRGLTPTLIREGHGCGTYFLVYEALIAQQISKGLTRKDIPAWKLCMFGALSGTALWLMIYPIDVIKSVMQTDNWNGKPKSGKNIIQVGRSIYMQNGIKGFLKGFGPTIIRAAPANGATFATFEIVMRLMG